MLDDGGDDADDPATLPHVAAVDAKILTSIDNTSLDSATRCVRFAAFSAINASPHVAFVRRSVFSISDPVLVVAAAVDDDDDEEDGDAARSVTKECENDDEEND